MTPREFAIKNGYYINIEKCKKSKNVITVKYPKNIFHSPPLEEDIIQYYLEDNEILVTDLKTKKTKKISSNLLNRRLLVVCDILARSTKRHLNKDLIVVRNKSKKITAFFEIPEHLKKEEKNILKILIKAVRREQDFDIKYKKIYDQFIELIELGGII